MNNIELQSDLIRYNSNNNGELAHVAAKVARLVDPNVSLGYYLNDSVKAFFTAAASHPRKNSMSYMERVVAWFKHLVVGDRNNPLPVLIYSRDEGVQLHWVTQFVRKGNTLEFEVLNTLGWERRLVNLTHIMPLFPSYFKGSNSFKTFREQMLPRYTAYDNPDDNPYVCKNTTKLIKIGKESMNSKTKTAVSTFIATETNSVKLAARIAAGNATNAVVKAALRPVVAPLVAKAVQPKGVVQRVFAANKVDEAVDTIMSSPVMDVLAAAILVGVTSSGLVKNEKLIAGAALASDAAAVKLQGVVDFDAIVKAITDKVGTVVDTLEHSDNV